MKLSLDLADRLAQLEAGRLRHRPAQRAWTAGHPRIGLRAVGLARLLDDLTPARADGNLRPAPGASWPAWTVLD